MNKALIYDAIIVGAGILGLATGYHIKNRDPNKRVLIVERNPGPGFEATGKSAGCFQGFFKSRTSRVLAKSSIMFYEYVERKLKINLEIRWIGFLWLLSEKHYYEIRSALKDMKGEEGEYRIIDAEELAKKMKVNIHASKLEEADILGLYDIHVGLLAKYAGTLNVTSLVKFYEREFLKLGGKIMYNSEVNELVLEPAKPLKLSGEPFYWQDRRISGVKIGSKILKAGKTILAAGGWIQSLLNNVGVESLIRPKKKSIYVIKADTNSLRALLRVRELNKEGIMPFTIITHPEIYVKPEIKEETFWIGHGLVFGMPFKIEDIYVSDEKFYEQELYPILSAYFPQFKDKRPVNSWSSIYEVTIDRQPVVFEENDLIVVGGGSGYGIMKADAIGRIAASVFFEENKAELFGGYTFKCSDLSIKHRNVEPELFIL